MNGIPIEDGDKTTGMEVIAKWKLVDASNDQVFYTDSNGLEMQTRILNKRPDFNLETNMTVSSNYYPVNSAIAIKNADKSLQMTVMNDRSQGGSVIEDGAIELMQNRRLLFDDNRGVAEPLNETDPEGRGIAVNARYYVQIFDTSRTDSLQRQTQSKIDDPVQYFFATQFNETIGDRCNSCKTYEFHSESIRTQV